MAHLGRLSTASLKPQVATFRCGTSPVGIGLSARRDVGKTMVKAVIKPTNSEGGARNGAALFVRTCLECSAALEGPAERDLVGVLQVPPDRQAAREPRDGDAHRLDEQSEVRRGRFALG